MSFWSEIDEFVSNTNKNSNSIIIPDNTEPIENSEVIYTKEQDKKGIKDNSKIIVDIVLITAVDDEYTWARKVFNNCYSEVYENGCWYCFANCTLANDKETTIAIFKQCNMGLVSAAATVTYAIQLFNPKMVLMCGVCAGVKRGINLGDLVVFSPVFEYGAGKYNNGIFTPDYRQRQLNGCFKPTVYKMCNDKVLTRKIKDEWAYDKPDTELAIHICAAGSGAAVVTDEDAVKRITGHQKELGAIDMEAYAVAEVASIVAHHEIPWLVVKGVQDFATPLKNDRYRMYAAYASAMFMKKFLELINL